MKLLDECEYPEEIDLIKKHVREVRYMRDDQVEALWTLFSQDACAGFLIPSADWCSDFKRFLERLDKNE